jgi:CheY-like chemotaxis protein
MDIQMPNMNGLDATKNIKAAKPELPVIALTAFAMQGDRERVLAEGCDEYLEKPVRQDKLIEMIRNFLM